ncbi:hypothetical protein MASR1M32_36740 [Rhodobacter sp.]
MAALRQATAGRNLWLLASSHPEDEAVAFAAHRDRLAADPDALLVIVPRDPPRSETILGAARAMGLTAARKSDALFRRGRHRSMSSMRSESLASGIAWPRLR